MAKKTSLVLFFLVLATVASAAMAYPNDGTPDPTPHCFNDFFSCRNDSTLSATTTTELNDSITQCMDQLCDCASERCSCMDIASAANVYCNDIHDAWEMGGFGSCLRQFNDAYFTCVGRCQRYTTSQVHTTSVKMVSFLGITSANWKCKICTTLVGILRGQGNSYSCGALDLESLVGCSEMGPFALVCPVITEEMCTHIVGKLEDYVGLSAQKVCQLVHICKGDPKSSGTGSGSGSGSGGTSSGEESTEGSTEESSEETTVEPIDESGEESGGTEGGDDDGGGEDSFTKVVRPRSGAIFSLSPSGMTEYMARSQSMVKDACQLSATNCWASSVEDSSYTCVEAFAVTSASINSDQPAASINSNQPSTVPQASSESRRRRNVVGLAIGGAAIGFVVALVAVAVVFQVRKRLQKRAAAASEIANYVELNDKL